MKKVIEHKTIKQKSRHDIEIDSDRGHEVLLTQNNFTKSYIHVEKSKAREVALAICPELGEPTIKTDNTKVIAHLESELEKAKELLKNAEVLFLLERTAPDFSATEYYSRATEIMKGINSFLECK